MKEKLRTHFLNLGPRRFVILAVIALIILDLLTAYYFRLSWETRGLSKTLIDISINQAKLNISDFSQETILEMSGLVNQTIDFLLLLLILNNLFFYLFYLKKRLWAQSYVLFYTLSAAILSLTMIFDSQLGFGWLLFNIATIPTYIYLYFGVKLLKSETILVPEKKAQ